MVRFLRSKLFITVILLAIAGVLTFYFLPKLHSAEEAKTIIIDFRDDVSAGSEITESMIEKREVGSYGMDSGVLREADIDSIVGTYAACDIHKRVYLYSDMFADTLKEVDGAMDTELQEGDKLITVSLSSGAKAVGGDILPGSWVDVYSVVTETETVTDTYGDETEIEKDVMSLTPMLTGVRVYKILNSSLQNITEINRKYAAMVATAAEDETVEAEGSRIPAFVTLIVSDAQAEALANQEFKGSVHLALYPEKTAEAWEETIAMRNENIQPSAADEEIETDLPAEELPEDVDVDAQGSEDLEPAA